MRKRLKLKKMIKRFIGKFLRNEPGIDKTKLGEYIGKYKDFNKKVLKTFVNLFDFKRIRIDQALRLFFIIFKFQEKLN